jgi:hypothetical protein
MVESENLDQIGEKLKQLQDQGLSNANATQVKSFIDIQDSLNLLIFSWKRWKIKSRAFYKTTKIQRLRCDFLLIINTIFNYTWTR